MKRCPNAGKVAASECDLCRIVYRCEVDWCENTMGHPNYISGDDTDGDGCSVNDTIACDDCYRNHQFETWWLSAQETPCPGCGARWKNHQCVHSKDCALMEFLSPMPCASCGEDVQADGLHINTGEWNCSTP